MMDKKFANEQLRFAIAVLQGKWGWNEPFCRNNRVALAIMIKNRLKTEGFWWQAQKLEIWIRRFRKGDFYSRRSSGGVSAERSGAGCH